MQELEKRDLLKKRLLNQAGNVAFVIDSEYWIDKVFTDGRFFSGEDSVIENGDAGRCHINSIEHHLKDKDLKVCTGFSMNNGRWVRHSWCVDSEGKVHECTPITRELYYGAVLDEEDTVLLRRDWDFEFDAKMRMADLKRPVLTEALREAEDCKYFIRRCIDDSCLLDPEIETRRKDDINGEEWTPLKSHLYSFKENFFRNIGKSPFENSLTDYKKEALEYLERSYPFCFGIDLRRNQELFYASGLDLELDFYALALGATEEQVDEVKEVLKNTKLESINGKGKIRRLSGFSPKKDTISLDSINGSSIDTYSADNLYDALKSIDDKHVSGFIEYLLIKDYENNPNTLFNGTCVEIDDNGNTYVSEGNHRILTAKALQIIKQHITGKKPDKSIEFTGTIDRIVFQDKGEDFRGWE